MKSRKIRDFIRESNWILQLSVPYRGAIVLYILLGLFATVSGLCCSVVSKRLIDAVIADAANTRLKAVLGIGIVYLLLGILRLCFNAFSKRIAARLSVKISNEIRRDVFRRFLDVDWFSSLQYHSGDLLSRINGDTETVASGVLGWIPGLITGLFQLAATMGVICYYDPAMGLVALAGAPLTLLLSRYILPKMRRLGRQVRDTQSKMTAFYEESLQNLQAVKAFHLKKRFIGKLEDLQELYRDVYLESNLFSVTGNLLLTLASFAVSTVCLGFGIYRLWTGYIGYGTLVMFLSLARIVSSSFSGLASLVPAAVSATVSAGRIMAILSLPVENDILDPEDEELLSRAKTGGAGICFDRLSFGYRKDRPVLTDFSLTVKPGEIVGIVSPSGGGKTTLLRLTLGLLNPDGGRVSLDAGGLSRKMIPGLRPAMTYVSQEKAIFSGSIRECLSLYRPDATEDELRRALQTACALSFTEALPLGLDTPLGERGSGLSEGQLQRLSIARALVGNAPILLLDEATSALDFETEKQVLSNIMQDGGSRTLLVTTHRPTVLSSCDRVFAIEKGSARRLSDREIAGLLKEN